MSRVFRETKQDITFFSTHCLDFPAHIHEDIEIIFVKKGSATVYCDGTKYLLSDRSFFIAFPNQVHHYIDSALGDFILLIVKPAAHEELFKGQPLSSVCTNPDNHTVMLLEMALEEYEEDGFSPVIAAYLSVFFEKLMTFFEVRENNSSHNTVYRILRYCNEHYREDISIAALSHALHLSKSSISHIFSQRLGISFSDHINALRLNDAVHLLKAGHHSITEISQAAGFPTIRTFNRAFQRQYGMSPSEYKKTLQS